METNNKLNVVNIFQEGKIAHGDSFIGRHDLMFKLMRAWNESGGNGTYSVVGLNRMGKTSLVHEFCDRVKKLDPSTICIIVSLGHNSWPNLIQAIAVNILHENEHLDDVSKMFCQRICRISLENRNMLNENEVHGNYVRLLEHFEEIGQHFMLVIDEFDSAKEIWKNKINYFEGIRDSVQQAGFYILVSRRPLEAIEMDSYGNSCFHNVFTEFHVCAFDREIDMKDYYNVLSERYGIELNEDEREKVEEYTGFCPTFLVGVGNRLASASINHMPQPSIEDIFHEQNFQTNYQRHYKEFLSRMINDGLWDELVQIIMDISSIRKGSNSEDTFREATINNLCCRGYLRQKENGEYVVFSDDFTAWARNNLYHDNDSSIYSRIIKAEVAIRDLLREKMPEIWNNLHPGRNWEADFLEDSSNVPDCASSFTRRTGRYSSLETYLWSARKFKPDADVADALTMPVKLDLVKLYWKNGISERFNSAQYSEWKKCFKLLKDVRNPLFHATITPNDPSANPQYNLLDVNAQADRVIRQLQKK